MKIHLIISAMSLIALHPQQSLAAPANTEQIKAAISGNTVEGNTDFAGPYAEYYAPGGTVFGKNYQGKWSAEGDKMCFVYDESPKECWAVDIEGDQVKWVKDGKAEGNGTILKGNTNNFK